MQTKYHIETGGVGPPGEKAAKLVLWMALDLQDYAEITETILRHLKMGFRSWEIDLESMVDPTATDLASWAALKATLTNHEAEARFRVKKDSQVDKLLAVTTLDQVLLKDLVIRPDRGSRENPRGAEAPRTASQAEERKKIVILRSKDRRLNRERCQALKESLERASRQALKAIVLDLEGVDDIDSQALHILAEARLNLLVEAREGLKEIPEIHLCGLSGQGEDIFKLAQYDRLFKIHRDLKAALDHLS